MSATTEGPKDSANAEADRLEFGIGDSEISRKLSDLITKKFGTFYMDREFGNNVARVSDGYIIFEFKCSCGSTDINCKCINNKKRISKKTVKEFKEMGLPEYGEKIFLPDYSWD